MMPTVPDIEAVPFAKRARLRIVANTESQSAFVLTPPTE